MRNLFTIAGLISLLYVNPTNAQEAYRVPDLGKYGLPNTLPTVVDADGREDTIEFLAIKELTGEWMLINPRTGCMEAIPFDLPPDMGLIRIMTAASVGKTTWKLEIGINVFTKENPFDARPLRFNVCK